MSPYLKSFMAILAILIMSSCQTIWRQPFPSTDIVFQGDHSKYEIGFVNEDGSNPTKIKTGYLFLGFEFGGYLAKPKWSIDKNYIYGLRQANWDASVGFPSFWKQGEKISDCPNWGTIVQMEVIDSETVIINSFQRGALLVDLESCIEIEKLLDFSGDLLKSIEGISYSPDQTTLLYGEVDHKLDSYQIISLDLSSEQVHALARGINPSWSPDGTNIAYVQADGIYIMKKDGTQKNKVVDHEFFDSQNTWTTREIAQPRWSPDGDWLVYHQCPEKYYCSLTEIAIYKVEVSTGKIYKIIEGGFYPDWRK